MPAALTPLTPESIFEELEKVLKSSYFARSKRLSRFLRFTVQEAIEGNSTRLKEYLIGTEVFDKTEAYDTRSDSIVRVVANRLRSKLRAYYANGGATDTILIDFPKGGYIPVFEVRTPPYDAFIKSVEARKYYSEGRFLRRQRTETTLRRSVECFQASIVQNPSFAPAHSALARSLALLCAGGHLAPQEGWPKVKSAAAKALELDPSSVEANIFLALARGLYDHDWAGSERQFRQTLEIDPYSASTRYWFSVGWLAPMGLLSTAIGELNRAHAYNPFVPAIREGVAMVLFLAGQWDAVLGQTEDLVDGANSPESNLLRALALAHQGRHTDAISAMHNALGRAPRNTRLRGGLGYIHALAGSRAQAEQIAESLESEAAVRYVSAVDIAAITAGLGEQDRTLDLLERAAEERDTALAMLNVDPRFSGLRQHIRYAAILERTGLSGQQSAASGRQ